MKELLDQGLAVSKDFALKAGEKAQDLSEKGYEASKKLAVKAGAKAQELGERGVLTLEIRQLESRAQKLIGRLGTEAYQAFVERGVKTLSAETAAIKTILNELALVRESLEKKEAEVQRKKG
jgi:predicted Fe-Mo cluster-binding NifX family protein